MRLVTESAGESIDEICSDFKLDLYLSLPESEKAKYRTYKSRLLKKYDLARAEAEALAKVMKGMQGKAESQESLMASKEVSGDSIEEAVATPRLPLSLNVIKASVLSLAFLFFLGSLVYFGAEARGFTSLGWYWSGLVEVSGAILLIYPTGAFGGLKVFWKKKAFWLTLLLRGSGLLCIGLGFFVMDTAGEDRTQKAVTKVVQVDSEIGTLSDQIARKKQSITDDEILRDRLPERFLKARAERQRVIDMKNDELTALQNKKIEAEKKISSSSEAKTAVKHGSAETNQRLLLILLAVVTGHGMVSAISILIKTYVQKPFEEAIGPRVTT